jgi:hypothetical protein
LLYFANPSFDFRDILFKVTNFIYLCLLDEDIVQAFLSEPYGQIIAVACICCALKSLGMGVFKEQLWDFLFN